MEEKTIDEQLTVNGLPLPEYERLRKADRQLKKLRKDLAFCATINVDVIDRKEEKYRKYRDKVQGDPLTFPSRPKPAEQEMNQLMKLEDDWAEELEHPQVTIDGNKAAEIILRYAALALPEHERKRLRYDDGLPDGCKVKIE